MLSQPWSPCGSCLELLLAGREQSPVGLPWAQASLLSPAHGQGEPTLQWGTLWHKGSSRSGLSGHACCHLHVADGHPQWHVQLVARRGLAVLLSP